MEATEGDNCKNCNEKKGIYKCPACTTISCSVSCVKAHKAAANCTGLREVKRSDDEILLQDCGFLENIRSKLERGLIDSSCSYLQEDSVFSYTKNKKSYKRNDLSSINPSSLYTNKLPHKLRHQKGLRIPNFPNKNENSLLFRKDIPLVLRKLRLRLKKQGTKLSFMSRNMSRRMINTTHISSEDHSIKWHIVMRFIHANIYFQKTVDQNCTIGEIISEYLESDPRQLKGFMLDKTLANVIKDESIMDDSVINKDAKNILATTEELSKIEVCNSSINDFCPQVETPSTSSESFTYVREFSKEYKEMTPSSLTDEQQREILLYQAAEVNGLAVLLLNEDPEDPTKYNCLEVNKTLKESLQNLRIIEYPILLVMRKEHSYELLNNKNVHSVDEIDQIVEANKSTNVFKSSMKYFTENEDLIN